MRNEEDFLRIKVTVERLIDLDYERIEADPIWQNIVAAWHPLTATTMNAAIESYLMYYISNNKFPHNTPSTNGPGDVIGYKIQLVGQ